jgi:nucleoside-diphosphate-sugar epimerase
VNLLVTGHLGYIGSHLFWKLNSLGHNVMGIDLKMGEDILDGFQEKHFRFNPDVVFHLAAIPRVVYSIENPAEVMHNNVLSTSLVLEFAKKVGAKVVYSSSSSVVGNGDGPESPYALSKYVGEVETLLYNKLYGTEAVSLRYFNVYSADQVADGPYATCVANWRRFIKEGKTPYITGDGNQRRDMAHVDDVVSANVFCMENIEKVSGNAYDVGTGNNISLNEMKDLVLKSLPDLEFEYVEDRPGDVTLTKADIQPLIDLGWSPKVDITRGIARCFTEISNEQN